jgi:hypothetical protein
VQGQLVALQSYVAEVEATVSQLLGMQERAARVNGELRQRAVKAEGEARAKETRCRLAKADLCSARRRLESLESQFVETLTLLRDYQKSTEEANKLLEQSDRRGGCVVCLTSRASVMLLSCSHCAMCQACCSTLRERTRGAERPRCPVCREPFCGDDVARVLFP